MKRLMAVILAWLGICSLTFAAERNYGLDPQQIAPDVFVFTGKTEDFNETNGGNIVNTGFIVGPQGVVVIDTGPSLIYGRQMRAAIARVTDKPVMMVINTHHHPDHFLGNQAFADVPISTIQGVQKGIVTEGNAFAENLYRMTGDWMAGTDVVAPAHILDSGHLVIGGRSLRVLPLDGHTGSDLAVIDETSGVLFTGDLVFDGRTPTTPHADVTHWLSSLSTLEALMKSADVKVLVPGHGQVSRNTAAINWTRDWLTWLTGSLRDAAEQGLDMNEVLERTLPQRFQNVPLSRSEYRRSVSHLYSKIEETALTAAKP